MMSDVDTDTFDKAEVAKWTHLPNAFTGDLVEELVKRRGVQCMDVPDGGRFEFFGPGKIVFVSDGFESETRGLASS